MRVLDPDSELSLWMEAIANTLIQETQEETVIVNLCQIATSFGIIN